MYDDIDFGKNWEEMFEKFRQSNHAKWEGYKQYSSAFNSTRNSRRPRNFRCALHGFPHPRFDKESYPFQLCLLIKLEDVLPHAELQRHLRHLLDFIQQHKSSVAVVQTEVTTHHGTAKRWEFTLRKTKETS